MKANKFPNHDSRIERTQVRMYLKSRAKNAGRPKVQKVLVKRPRK